MAPRFEKASAAALPIPEVFVRSYQELDIAFLVLGTRINSLLRAKGIETVGAICRLTKKELRQIGGIGRDSFDTITFDLGQIGLALKAESSEA